MYQKQFSYFGFGHLLHRSAMDRITVNSNAYEFDLENLQSNLLWKIFEMQRSFWIGTTSFSASSIFPYINYNRYRNMHCISICSSWPLYQIPTNCNFLSWNILPIYPLFMYFFFFSRVVLLGSIEVDQKLLFWTCLDSYHLLLAPFSSSML